MSGEQLPSNYVRADVLARAPDLIYAICGQSGDVPNITFAFTTDPKAHVEHFATAQERDFLWNGFSRIMMRRFELPCMAIEHALFQPMHLSGVACYDDSQVYFVVLSFVNNRELRFGYRDQHAQVSVFENLLRALGVVVPTIDSDPMSPVV